MEFTQGYLLRPLLLGCFDKPIIVITDTRSPVKLYSYINQSEWIKGGLIIQSNCYMFSQSKRDYLSVSSYDVQINDNWPIIDNKQCDTWCV